MRKKAKIFLLCCVFLCALNGCSQPASPASGDPAGTSGTAGNIPAIEDEEPPSLADSVPEAVSSTITVPSSEAPETASKADEGSSIQVSDDHYRDIVDRTLQTAWALQSGQPVFDGIEDLIYSSPDYVLDIEGMPLNLERRSKFYNNVKAGSPDDILVILVGPDEDAPVMVETYHYGGSGSEFAVEQIYAEKGQIIRKSEKRSAPK